MRIATLYPVLAMALGAAALTALPTPSRAQAAVETPPAPNRVPQDVVDTVRSKGRVIDTSIAALYAPRQARAVPGVTRIPNLKYGSDPRQFVNLFVPATRGATPAPVVLFVHGGAFVAGSASTPNSFSYDHIGNFLARNGYVAAVVEYRLAPAFPWPAGGQDMAGVVEWTRQHIAEYGGDPAKIVLMGHSAGATHVAHYSFDTRMQVNGGKDGVVGAILMSPVLGLENIRTSPAYYGASPTPDMAPLSHVNERKLPVFLVMAQYDPPLFQQDAQQLFSALCARDGQCPAIKMMQQHSHLSSIYSIDTADDSVGSDLLTFIREVAQR